jgi:hypothetical protein
MEVGRHALKSFATITDVLFPSPFAGSLYYSKYTWKKKEKKKGESRKKKTKRKQKLH